ncbi:DUF1598 domain-containing protein [Bremerella cremea]|uniref:DUF1598 domain-containing protein n=1 Tax=Blastopirellula marina TaxID=124 RepID=A0A2S8FQI5_9BACT|nr:MULTISPECIES: DUF1598 domain-containing protein [Pirellulaceae]PQO34104.1 hypothetical protein C5Y83_11200 [Blastopirellula marina]RCS46601.1 DUF1598 domain-containing protein [Bremerella cremea]
MKAVVLPRVSYALLLALGLALVSSPVFAGQTAFRQQSVGGVSIDAQGQLTSATPEVKKMLRQEMLAALDKVPGNLATPVKMRKVSLRGLNAIMKSSMETDGELPDAVKYMAGLQRIEYVFVDEANDDVILAGPAEGWTVDENGNVVGLTTGRPVLMLEDFIVAMRSVQEARRAGITCSIDPTAQGRQNLDNYLASLSRMDASVKDGVERALGPQVITVTGVPTSSHFARVLVAADFRMKRIAMNLDPSPVRGLPSYLQMLPSARAVKNAMPRWWLACNYEPMAQSEDGLAWQLRGPGVKAMTEDEYITEDGSVKQSGKTSPLPQKWADLMTANYEELSAEDKIFGDLRNVMDMCVIAALMEKEQLLAKANLDLDMIKSDASPVALEEFPTPSTVPTFFSAMKKGSQWVITASGGVDINSWEVASHTEKVAGMDKLRTEQLASNNKLWWWN